MTADQHHHPDDELLAALSEQYDAVPFYPRCGRCWEAARRICGVPACWTYSPEEQAVFDAMAKTIPPSTHLYAPSCKCGQGCADEYLCAACAATVEKPQFVERLTDGTDDNAARPSAEQEEGG